MPPTQSERHIPTRKLGHSIMTEQDNLIEHYVAEDATGPARIIVPISEDLIMRAVFNGVARHLYDRPLQTSDEIEEVWEFQKTYENDILEALDEVGDIDPRDRADIARIVEAVEAHFNEEFNDD